LKYCFVQADSKMCLSQALHVCNAHHTRSDHSIKKTVRESSNLRHSLPCEEGATSMSELTNAMQLDADSQVDTFILLCYKLDGIVRINDLRKVNLNF
jgi:hypothetical protein